MSKYLVVDCETTGLDPEIHGIITLSAVVYDGPKKVSQWHGVNKEWQQFTIDSSALKVNNISLYQTDYFSIPTKEIVEGKADQGYYILENYSTFVRFFVSWMLENAVNCDFILGMNVQFDISFIKKACNAFNIKIDSLLPRKQIDPLIIAAAASDAGILNPDIKYFNSQAMYNLYEIDSKGIHRSDIDVRLAFELWQKMKKDIFS